MSPHAVNSLVTDLVQMAKAMEELPRVQADLAAAEELLRDCRDTIDYRGTEITSLRSQIISMTTRIKQAEANRDDAELRFRQLKDIVSDAATASKMVTEAMDMADALANSRVVTPVAEEVTSLPLPDAVLDTTEASAVSAPSAGNNTSVEVPQSQADPTVSGSVKLATAHGSTTGTDTVGERVLDPTARSEASPLASPPDASTGNASPSDSATLVEPKPFADMPWSEWYLKPDYYFVNLSEWISGGGTESAYYR